MLLIFEAGINHNGDIEIAKRLIDMAVEIKEKSNIPKEEIVIKFQKREPTICVPFSQREKLKETPWGEMTYLDYKKKLEFGKKEYDEIDAYCKEKDILWTASAWDIPSVEFLDQYNLPFIKIPSAKITDEELVKECGKRFSNIIISTGMSTEEEIDQCMNWLGGDCSDLTILHCNSSYPASDDELNLNYLLTLQKKYPEARIGYSGHEVGISASIVSAVLGAEVIERHITLDRSMWGTDQAASIVFDQAYRLARDLNKIDVWLGDGIKKVYDSEKEAMKKLRWTEYKKK